MESRSPYPLHLEGELAPQLSRGLWLVKWLLLVPHIIVLVFLWLAFVIAGVGAFLAILATGRYPRPIFDFNVGVLRWTWRVGFYSYSALATDQYPPFTLADVPDYPARLSVAYPKQLSRGLALVKWWLLAIPHYLIVAFFAGGAFAGYNAANDGDAWGYGISLIDVLVVFAGIVLLVRGRYPRGIFDLVMGLNRWVFRVAAYASLMTDTYPPFRLDMGSHEPPTQDATGPVGPKPTAAAA